MAGRTHTTVARGSPSLPSSIDAHDGAPQISLPSSMEADGSGASSFILSSIEMPSVEMHSVGVGSWTSLPSSIDDNEALSSLPSSMEAHDGAIQAHGGRQIQAHGGPQIHAHDGAVQAHGGSQTHAHSGGVQAHGGTIHAAISCSNMHSGTIQAHGWRRIHVHGGDGGMGSSHGGHELNLCKIQGDCTFEKRKRSAEGLAHGPKRRRGTWWDREQQCKVRDGVDFVQDTEEGAQEEFVFLHSNQDGSADWLNPSAEDVEVVREIELQPKLLGVDPDAETDDEFSSMKGNKTSDKEKLPTDLNKKGLKRIGMASKKPLLEPPMQ